MLIHIIPLFFNPINNLIKYKMKKIMLINYFFAITTSLISLITVYIYNHQVTILKQNSEKEDPRRFIRLYDLLLTPMRRLLIFIFIYDLCTAGIFCFKNVNKLKGLLKLNKTKIAVQIKTQGGYGAFLIELMLSFFIKFLSLSALIYFTIESLAQIHLILELYKNELDDYEKNNLNKNIILVKILFIAEICIALFYVVTFILKFLIVKRENGRIAIKESCTNSNYSVLDMSNSNNNTSDK